jgi:hypothetical protein
MLASAGGVTHNAAERSTGTDGGNRWWPYGLGLEVMRDV